MEFIIHINPLWFVLGWILIGNIGEWLLVLRFHDDMSFELPAIIFHIVFGSVCGVLIFLFALMVIIMTILQDKYNAKYNT